nr:MAG TPA: hypothetical protein [Bacteriophage sp.]
MNKSRFSIIKKNDILYSEIERGCPLRAAKGEKT